MNGFYIGLYLLGGASLLYLGAECLILGGASFALRMGLTTLVIGLTVMGYGTGTPELVVSIQASLEGRGDIALGNVIGSNIANIGLILGLTALCRPISLKNQQLAQLDGPVMVLVTFLLCALKLYSDDIVRWQGVLLCIGIVVHTAWTIYKGKKENLEVIIEEEGQPRLLKSVVYDIGLIFLGFFILFLGGRLFLNGAIEVAKIFQLSDAVIGLTVVALGTSLPELALSVVAMLRKHQDMALGNIVGSNIFNVLAIIGVASLIQPIHVVNIDWIDYMYFTAITVSLWMMIRRGKRIERWEGALMLLSYLVYMGYLVLTATLGK